MENVKQISIIGGGIVGICCALSLQDKGLHVTLIDEGALKRKASYGNAGVISPWACVPISMPGIWKSIPQMLLSNNGPVAFRWSYLPQFLPWAIKFLAAGRYSKVKQISTAMDALNRPNVTIYRQHLSQTTKHDLIKDCHYLHVSRDRQAFSLDSLGYQLRQHNNASMEILDAQQLQHYEPALSSDFRSALLIKNQARAIAPGQLVEVLTEKFCKRGGELISAKVKKIQPIDNHKWNVQLQGQLLTADNLLIAAGAWSVELLKPLGLTLPLVNERGYHLEFNQPGIELNHSILDVKSKFVVSSMANGVRSAGTAEFANIDAKPNYQRARIFNALTKQLLPDLNTKHTSEWMGTRPSFPDSLPVISAVPGFNRLFAAFGHSHFGLAMAPKTGQLMADIVCAESSDIDPDPYRFERFAA